MKLEKIKENHYKFVYKKVAFYFVAYKRNSNYSYLGLTHGAIFRFDKYRYDCFISKELLEDKKALKMYLGGMAEGFIKKYKL